MKNAEPHTRKITAHLPADLLKSAQAATGKGITETVREGLEMLARAQAYDTLLGMYGKLKIDLDIRALREDRKQEWK